MAFSSDGRQAALQRFSLATALARLCEREGLDATETTAILAVALTWAPGLPREPAPLLRTYTMAA